MNPMLQMAAPLQSYQPNAEYRTTSYGCELYPHLAQQIKNLHRSNLVDHLQVTMPNISNFDEVSALAVELDIPLIVHSNLLNLFGDNHWDGLRAAANNVRRLKPLHVVEHFSLLRSPNHLTFPGFYPSEIENPQVLLARAVDNINRWRDILGIDVAVENIPITSHIDIYFDLMLAVREKTKCNIACDIPHLLISMAAAGKSPEQTLALAKALNPTQVHFAGLSISEGTLKDSHHFFQPWTLSFAKRAFPQAMYFTFEQSSQVGSHALDRFLTQARISRLEPIASNLEAVLSQKSFSEDAIYHEYSLDAVASLLGVESDTAKGFLAKHALSLINEVKVTPMSSLFDLLDSSYLFIKPFQIFRVLAIELEPPHAMRVFIKLIRSALSYGSWFEQGQASAAIITYGEGEHPKFSSQIQVSAGAVLSPQEMGSLQKIRIPLTQNRWIEAHMPQLNFEIDRKENPMTQEQFENEILDAMAETIQPPGM